MEASRILEHRVRVQDFELIEHEHESECIIIPLNRAASPPPVQAYVHTLSREPVRTSVLQAVPVNVLHHRNQLVILQAVVALDELANTRLGDVVVFGRRGPELWVNGAGLRGP